MGDLSRIEIIYWASTIIGGTLFLLRTIMMLVGGGLGGEDFDTDFDGDLDVDVSMDFDHAIDHAGTSSDSDFSFKMLSMQGLTAFFMMFGLVGLALVNAKVLTGLTIVGGIFAGLFAVWLISMVFAQMKRLQSDGTINIKNAVGETASVYLTIPAVGSGQVQVIVQGTLKIFDAVSTEGAEFKTGSKVRVVRVIDHHTLEVEAI